MRILTVNEAAERLSVKPKTIREWLKTGVLTGAKIGSRWRIREEDIDAFLVLRKRYKDYLIEARPEHLKTDEWAVYIHIERHTGDKMTINRYLPKEDEDIRYSSKAEAISECFRFGIHLIDTDQVGF